MPWGNLKNLGTHVYYGILADFLGMASTDIIKSEEAVDAAKTRRGNRSATYHSEVTSLVRSRSSGHP